LWHAAACYAAKREEGGKEFTPPPLSKHLPQSILWISCVFFCRFPETAGEFHDNFHDGLVNVCRRLLLKAFPCFDINGYEELRSAAPVLYMEESAKDVGLHVCCRVMLGEQCAFFKTSTMCLICTF